MPSTGLTEILVTLLKKNPENPGFTVEESQDEKTLSIKINPDIDAKEFLCDVQKVFKSHHDTAGNIPFKLHDTLRQTNINFPQIQNPLLSISELQNLGATKILEKLFGKEKICSIGLQPEWELFETNSGQVVYRAVCTKEIEIPLRICQINIYKYILSHASWDDLYSALSSINSSYIKDPSSDDSEIFGVGPLSKHLDQLFCIREENNKKVIYMDFEGLIKCIVAPQFNFLSQQGVSSASTIIVDKSHFMLYMSAILNSNQGILLHEHKDRQLLPISVACSTAIQSETLINFMIDCSGSMHSVFPKLKTLLKDLISKMHDHKKLDKNSTTIRLSRFGSRKSNFSVANFPLTKISELKKAIDEFEQPSQQTAIYQFIHEQHSFYRGLNEKYNIISILITDGQDNDSEINYKPNESSTDELSKELNSLAKQTNPPQYFSIEIGESIDEMVLDIIRRATNGTRIKAGDNLEDFKLIFDHLGRMSLYRNFMYFVQDTRKFRLPVIEGNTVIASKDNYLEPNKPFTINQISCTASETNVSSRSFTATGVQTEDQESDLQTITPEESPQVSPTLMFSANRFSAVAESEELEVNNTRLSSNQTSKFTL